VKGFPQFLKVDMGISGREIRGIYHMGQPQGVLEEIPGRSFGGIITSDFWGTYRKFGRKSGALIQFCRAHLIREVLFLGKLKERGVVGYGNRVIKQIWLMFETIGMKEEVGGR
jgi:hypothetical protein